MFAQRVCKKKHWQLADACPAVCAALPVTPAALCDSECHSLARPPSRHTWAMGCGSVCGSTVPVGPAAAGSLVGVIVIGDP